MSTPKRERQRQNRMQRIAADEAATKKYVTNRRIKRIGLAAVVVGAAIAVIGYLQRDDSEPATTPEPVAEVIGTGIAEGEPVDGTGDDPATDTDRATDPVSDPEGAQPDGGAAAGCPAADGSSPRTIDFDAPSPSASIPRPSTLPSSTPARARCASS